MHKVFLSILLCFCGLLVRGQITLIPVVGPNIASLGNPMAVELLYVTLFNASSDAYQVKLNAKLFYNNDPNPVVEGTSKQFELDRYTNLTIDRFSAERLLYPITQSTIDPGFAFSVANTSTLPTGSYVICIEVLNASDNISIGSNGCPIFSVTNNDFTAVNLLTPLNQGTTPNAYPILTWTMLSGGQAAFDPDRYYAVKIVNLLEGQSPQIAIQANPALFLEDQLSMNQLQYPITSQPLIPCSTYAWQVEAYRQLGLQRQSLATSEVWSFKIACGSGIVLTPGGGNGAVSGNGTTSGGGGTLGNGIGSSGVATACADCDSVLCKNYGVTLKRIRKDSAGYYQIWLENKYTGSDRNFQPRSVKMVMRTDSVLAMPDSLSSRWNLETGTPVKSKAQGWTVKSTRIQQGITTPGNIQFSGPSTDFVEVLVQWKNRKNRIICRDTIKVFENYYYFDLNGDETDVVQETAEKKLRVQFHNPYAATEHLDVKIYDLATRQLVSPSTDPFSNQGTLQGLNRIAIDLQRYPLTTGKTYLLEVTDHMSHYQMKFKPITQNPSSL
jgi:hypothetical protein